jgi:PAS domain S-box-containing protein
MGQDHSTSVDMATLANALPVGVAIADSAGQLLFVNEEMARMTGYALDELVGRSVDDLLPSKHRESHAHNRAKYSGDPIPRAMGAGRELFAFRRDGTEFPVEVGLRPLTYAGQPAVLASVIDCTERRQIESGFRAVVEAAPYGMLLVDPKGRIALTNNHLRAAFGYTEAELVGQAIEILLPERQRHVHVPLRDAFISHPSYRVMGEGRDLTGRRKDGVEIPVEIGLSSLTTAAGRMVMASVVDITRRKRAEMLLREANAQLEEFAYVASHDLRSPLRGVSHLVGFLRDDLPAELAGIHGGQLDRIDERICRMEGLIEDLLTYAKAGKRSVSFDDIDLSEMLNEIVKLDPPPAGMAIEFDLKVQPFEGVAIPLATVLRNLYSNAIKHHDTGHGLIKVSAREEGELCVIAMSDDGPGIPENAQGRSFRLFQTLTASERRGSGLGLAVSKRLVEGHGGTIELISSDGQRGTTFVVRWPRFMRSDLDD